MSNELSTTQKLETMMRELVSINMDTAKCDNFIHNKCYLIEVKGLEKA